MSASTASPATSPLEASTPEAMSQATTGAPQELIALIAAAAGSRGAPSKPVPKIASTTAPESRSRSAPPQLLPRPEHQRLDLEPHLPQQPRRDEAIATVVALPANHPHRSLRRQLRHSLSHSPPRRLHQLQRRHPKLLNRPPVNPPH